MTVRILRRPKAAQDAEQIADYIARDSLEASVRFLENTESTIRFLAEFPAIGSLFKTKLSGVKNMRVFHVKGFPNHVIFYLEHPGAIELIRILHGARDFESELGKS